jgi:hypothetical protein
MLTTRAGVIAPLVPVMVSARRKPTAVTAFVVAREKEAFRPGTAAV